MLQLVLGRRCGGSLGDRCVFVGVIDAGTFAMLLKQDELLRQVGCHCGGDSRVYRSLSIGGLLGTARRQLHHRAVLLRLYNFIFSDASRSFGLAGPDAVWVEGCAV